MEITKIQSEDKEYPNRLLEIKKHPKELYTIGNVELLNSTYAVGIVGARECSEYGRKVAFSFAKELSKNGICIISGMAIGIDGASHNGAIEEKGKTIGILGSGLNYIYPKENEWLFHKIITNGGCILSEYEPNVEVDMQKFPKRNRIISALSDIILVVEAEYRSGSSITAKYAKEMGKTVCAIPSNIDSYTGIGTNRMLQEGAKLITKPSQIIEILECENKKENTSKEEIMPKEYLPIYQLLSNKPTHINEIAKKLKTSISEISPMLTMMELEGYIIQEEMNQFKKRG